MESLIDNTNNNPLNGKTKTDLQELKRLTNKNNQLLIKYFKQNYHFSKLLFIYDADYKKLVYENDFSHFLDESLNKMTAAFESNSTYLCRIGTTQVNEGSAVKSLVIADLNGKDIFETFSKYFKV